MRTLEGESFDVDIIINKIIDKNNKQIIVQENIHTESKPCEWISSASWEFVPTAGKYSMLMHTSQGNSTGGETSSRNFTVIENILNLILINLKLKTLMVCFTMFLNLLCQTHQLTR